MYPSKRSSRHRGRRRVTQPLHNIDTRRGKVSRGARGATCSLRDYAITAKAFGVPCYVLFMAMVERKGVSLGRTT
eukprot:scaffold135470_cov38-Tisochrysis_lutea.AAC.1